MCCAKKPGVELQSCLYHNLKTNPCRLFVDYELLHSRVAV